MIQLTVTDVIMKRAGIRDIDNATLDDVITTAITYPWTLGRKAESESIVLVTRGDTVCAVMTISALRLSDGKSWIEGIVLDRDHPVFLKYVGHPSPAPGTSRNPVRYISDPEIDSRSCLCGCGLVTNGNRAFLPGHDQRAIHERIRRHFGGVTEFLKWCDAQEGDSAK